MSFALRRWFQVLRAGTFGRGVCPHQFAFILEIPTRRLVLSPARLAERLHLSPDSRVLEVGCGPGYFSVEVARRLSMGHLVLFDLQVEMLRKARRKLAAAKLRSADAIHGDACSLPFAEAVFDVVFLVTVLGEVHDPAACLSSAYRVLRPGGLLSVTEQLPDPDYVRFARLRGLALEVGFDFTERFGRAWSYTANFRRAASDAVTHERTR